MADAIDKVLALDNGDRFRVRGKEYTKTSGVVTHRADRTEVTVFNSAGKQTRVSIRPDDKIAVTHRAKDPYGIFGL